jgi:hypothetical protein
MATLNRAKPFGQVWGSDPSVKHVYDQGGKFFNGAEQEVDPKTGAVIGGGHTPPGPTAPIDQLATQTSNLTETDDANALTAEARAALVEEAKLFLAGKSIDALKAELPDVEDSLLDVMADAETAGQARKGALEAIGLEQAARIDKAGA